MGLRVLGIAGSPRRGGNTDTLLGEALRGAASRGGEPKTLILNELKIIDCQHCDHCLKSGLCRYNDDMQTVYRELEAADRIVLAAPVQFMGLPAGVKAMIDRCQALWARKYVLKRPPLEPVKERRGMFISVGGMKGERIFEPSLATVRAFFAVLNIQYAGELLFRSIDEKGAIDRHPEALRQAFAAGQKLAE